MERETPVRSAKRRPFVLIVDDDPTVVCTVVGLLKFAGIRTASTETLAGALREINQERPDLLLLDVHLPDGSRFDLCRRLNAEGVCHAIPILFISATNDTLKKVEGFDAGGVDYFTKPIVGLEVVARVRTHLRLKQANERLAELHAERMTTLATAQQKLMPWPDSVPQSHFYACVRQVLTAGGDLYDVISTGQGVVDYLVADASGHDLAASLWTACLKALAMEYATLLNPPEEIMRLINSSLCRLLPSGSFFTLIYARLNHRTGKLSLISAGHPPAIVAHLDDKEVTLIRQEGDVLGAFNNAVFGKTEMNLKSGDRLFLYTDGLIECRCLHEEGMQRLSDACVLRRNLALSESVPKVLEDITDGLQCPDDMLLMGIEP